MALVAYDNSDSSEYEDDDTQTTPVVTVNKNVAGVFPMTVPGPGPGTSASVPELTPKVPEPEEGPSLFNLLPRPSTKKPAVVEEDDEFLHKKENVANVVKTKAKITVPSLSDFKDVDDRPTAKPKAVNGKKSGLLSMLPQPRNTFTTTSSKSLIPHVLTKKPAATTVKKKEPLPSPIRSKTDKTLVTNYSDESDNEDEVQNDFFSFNKKEELPIDDVPLDIDMPVKKIPDQKKPRDIQSYFKQDVVQDHVELQPDYAETSSSNSMDHYSDASSSYSSYAAQESSSNNAVLDEEAILKLCGTRGKRKREDIQIVEVNQQEVLADAREWLLKGLMDDTSKRTSSSKRRGDEPTTQQRRKHQITYLAHQAKANETELQNQWANNRMSKRQTQSKYGF